ncbi:transcriptional regulator [Bhargavaea cecembensis]|uniref:Transcriptional regulator n=1 Tax=Bhargavaea cecembensis TaxID=394098 RepID=A0A161SPF4_9BACL|nr:transcriptional regulator [Bhargavaea cecembensis]
MAASEVFAVAEKETKEVVVKIPKRMLQCDGDSVAYDQAEQDGYVYLTTTRKTRKEQPNLIREAIVKGYVEMSQINLSIASECLYAEYEAEHAWRNS